MLFQLHKIPLGYGRMQIQAFIHNVPNRDSYKSLQKKLYMQKWKKTLPSVLKARLCKKSLPYNTMSVL